jgi:hypothetical protein
LSVSKKAETKKKQRWDVPQASLPLSEHPQLCLLIAIEAVKINASLIQADANKQSSIADQYLRSDRDPARPSRLSESRMQHSSKPPR